MPNKGTKAHTIDHASKGRSHGSKTLASSLINRNDSARVLIIGDSHIVRSGLRRIIEDEPDIQVVGDISVKEASVGSISHYSPRLVLIDLDSHSMDVLQTIGALHDALEQLGVLIMIDLADHELARKALTLGAAGIVLKMQPPAVLIAAIRELCQIHGPASIRQSEVTADAQRQHNGQALGRSNETGSLARVNSLTARERDILRLLGRGLKNKEIAKRLSISDITVRHHLTSIFCKLEVEDRQKLLILAHRHGLVNLAFDSELD